MIHWRSKLYGSYVSTAQTAVSVDGNVPLELSAYPQLRHVIERHVPADRSVRIADLGCGHGALIFCLRTLGYVSIEGVDVSPEQVALAKRLGIGGVSHGEIADFLKNRTANYDILFIMDVLEHLDKQELVDLLELVREALTEGGKVIIHVPNAEGIFGMRVRYGDLTHQICFTPQSIRQTLLATGFKHISVYEDKPIVHGTKSLIRRVLWDFLTVRERLLLLAETGAMGHVLSQNMLVVTGK